jgi:hypothetical protein
MNMTEASLRLGKVQETTLDTNLQVYKVHETLAAMTSSIIPSYE